MRIARAVQVAFMCFAPVLGAPAANYISSGVTPPSPAREFRGVWIATVNNIDWPSRPGLSTAEQQKELLGILDRAEQLKLNAVILQVRPQCDALYASTIEPWSEYLTGTMGKAPEPFYDPLAFAIKEAHRRGMELHAWINPFRALHFSSKSPVAANHVSKTHPEFVKRYGKYLWLDPGDPAAQDYSWRVVMDVVKRYDIDGVVFDDYFYLSGLDAGVGDADFPDEASWKRSGQAGKMSRDDWRRANVNRFVERVYRSIKETKPWVKFGISPFGIWRPGYPPQIKGTDSYARFYADSRKWLANGWVDYLAPQLYWPIGQKEQSFRTLLDWWASQNGKQRHLWPVLASYRAADWGRGEIHDQVELTRQNPGVTGYLLYSASSLMQDSDLDRTFERDLNRAPALVPASPWLGRERPGKPRAYVLADAGKWKLMWTPRGKDEIRWWVIQQKTYGDWKTKIIPGDATSEIFTGTPEILAVTAVDRDGNAGPACALQVKTSTAGTRQGSRDK